MIDLDTAELAFAHSVAAVPTRCDVVEVSGPDAAVFLQGQVSQDVERLEVGSSTQALLLQPQGKVDAWVRITRCGDDCFWLDVDAGYGELVEQRLNRFRIRVKVEVTLSPDQEVLAVRGPGAADGPAGLDLIVPEGGAVLDWTAGAERGAPCGFDLVGSGVTVPAGLPVGPPEALEAWRIRWGLPAMGRELDGSTIPAAAGIVDMSVSFTKGCFVGQELVARIDSRGATTPTVLRGIRFRADGPLDLGPGSSIIVDDVEVGQVTSWAVSAELGPIGLGYCRRSVEVPSAATVVDRSDRRLVVELIGLPFL